MPNTETSPEIFFVTGPISVGFIAEIIQKQSHNTSLGGHSIFLGQVRADTIGETQVKEIEYTSYEPLALEKMQEIRKDILTKYPLNSIQVFHSIGKIAVGEICIFVLTCARHRKAAMHACEEIVERIKSELPIWGKEIFEDDSQQWKINN